MSQAGAFVDAILDRTPEELIGALLIASALSGVMMGVDAIGRRKGPTPPIFVGVLVLVAGLVCMVLTAGYLTHEARREAFGMGATSPVGPGWAPPGGPGAVPGFGWSSGFHFVVAADRDRDGRVTPDDAARLVREADADGDGSVDFHEIDRLLLSRVRPDIPRPGPADPEGLGLDPGPDPADPLEESPR